MLHESESRKLPTTAHPIKKTLVVGIGSSMGDDQIGWLVVEQLADKLGSAIESRTARYPSEIIDWMGAVGDLVICDACRSKGMLGDLHRWEWPDDSLAICDRPGSHDMDLPFVLKLAERLGILPARVTIWGIEIGDLSPSPIVSDAMRCAVAEIASIISVELESRGQIRE